MNEKKYKLRILPLFEDDLNEIVDYIWYRLKKPVAAHNFIDAVEAAIHDRLSNPEAFQPYPSLKKRRYLYYGIPVKNYTVFYVVTGDIMEVRRICYSRRNIEKLL